jgi:hypothetical protein
LIRAADWAILAQKTGVSGPIPTKNSSTKDRWVRAAKEKALDAIRSRIILEPQAEQLLGCLKAGTVSTNVHLRKLHNSASR